MITPVPTRGARYLVLHMPAFRLERCGFFADDVAALTGELKNAVRLVALTPAAQATGLRVGMTATESRARTPEVELEPLDALGEEADRAALASAYGRLSDRVLVLSDDDLALEVGGTAHLFGGEAGMVCAVRELASSWGHYCRVAIADDPVAARAFAVAGEEDRIVAVGGTAKALADLPMWSLFPDEALAHTLRALGIRKVGQWASLDPASVSGRFGERGLRLHRVSRGQAASREPAVWATDTSPVIAEVVLGGPTVTLAPIHFVLQGLLHQVVETLKGRDEAVVRLAVRLVLDSGLSRVIAVSVGRPTRSVSTLERIVRTRLENLRLDAPVVELAIEVEEVSNEAGWQPGLIDRTVGEEALPDLLARLTDALGPQALFAAEPVSTWRPEAAWKAVPFSPDAPTPRLKTQKPDPVEAIARWEDALPCPRPTRLLTPPEPLQIRLQGERPAGVHSGRGWETVQRCEGPELLQSDWWLPEGALAASTGWWRPVRAPCGFTASARAGFATVGLIEGGSQKVDPKNAKALDPRVKRFAWSAALSSGAT